MTTLAAPPETSASKRRPLATAQEVAEYLNLPLQTTYELGRTGKLPGCVRVGRRMRFRMDVVEGWLEQQGKEK